VAEHLPARAALAFVGDDAERCAQWGIDASRRNPPALGAALDQLRARKSAYEIACMREANQRAAAGHRAVRDAFLAGARSELELHLLYLAATEQDDADTPYKNIIALGEHAGVLHHVHYGREPIARDTSLLVDAGATCLGYHADVTRTAVRGKSGEAGLFRGLIRELDGAQRELCQRVAVGTPFEQLHDQSHELLAELLRRVGIAKAAPEELVSTGVTRAFFPHGLGHALGLQTHDVGCRLTPPAEHNPFLRNTSAIADGQVFTIEPGCYFIPGLLGPLRAGPAHAAVDWVVVDRLARFGGIRIEDNIAAVGGVADNLTRGYLPA
jgi:Xaa-Pro dipeptidase